VISMQAVDGALWANRSVTSEAIVGKFFFGVVLAWIGGLVGCFFRSEIAGLRDRCRCGMVLATDCTILCLSCSRVP
jgi:hypothetical protein